MLQMLAKIFNLYIIYVTFPETVSTDSNLHLRAHWSKADTSRSFRDGASSQSRQLKHY